jgi:signal transduction histidine kinase
LEYAQTHEIKKQPEDIAAILNNVVSFLRVMSRAKGIEFVVDAGPVQSVLCDRYHLEQALLNLAINALAAMSESDTPTGTLTFRSLASVTPDGAPRVQIDVADSGVGIPPENIGRIFDAFYTTKEPGKGTGLGLAIVKEIIEAHGGLISVESTLGKGTVFHVVLPANAPPSTP